ncbi:hypothetical protein B9Z55_025289 [Caenorhabditis nigoni]|nr:hypothetical protein B9Z55_025289 [Caenorhabditis nigoni]
MPQNCFLVYSTALKAMVEEMRKVHNWLSDHTQKEQTTQGRLIYSLIVMDLRRELNDFEKRADAFEEAGNKNKSADQETIEYINRTSNAIHTALREWKSAHQPDEDFDVVIDKHSMGSFMKVLKRLNEMNDVEEKNKSQKVLVNGMAGEDMVEKSVEPEAKNGEKPQPKNGKAKQNGKRKRNGKKAQHEQPQEPEQNQSTLIEQPEPELAQQELVQAAPAEPEPEQQRKEQQEPPQQATSLEAQNAQKAQPKNGKRNQNGKRKRNGHQEQNGQHQEQPHEPEQNHSAHIDQQEPELAQHELIQAAPAEPKPEQQREEQPEPPQQATSLEPQNAQKTQTKNGNRKQNGKRKRNGHQEQNGQQQEQPHEPEQNHSAQIDQQEPVPIPPEESKPGQQQDQPEEPQQATSSLESSEAAV